MTEVPTARPRRRPQRTRAVAITQNLGYGVGVLTLVFLMYLVLRTQPIDCDRRFIVVSIMALGFAMAFSFIGGSASAEGKLPLPDSWSPIKFAVTGGIAAFLIILLVGWRLYAQPCVEKPPVATPLKPQDGLSIALPAGATFENGLQAFERSTQTKVVTANCPAEVLNAVVGPATIDAPSRKQWLEKLKLRVTQTVRYDVVEVENIRYEITCR